MLVDCLVHLEDVQRVDLDLWLRRAKAHDVGALIWAGTRPQRDVQQHMPPQTHDVRIWRALGLHPMCVDARTWRDELDCLANTLVEQPLIAIGECGLDARPGMPPLDVQERVFRAQLDIAIQARLPIILHQVHALSRCLSILKEYRPQLCGGMHHGYCGSWESAQQLLASGFFLSFGRVLVGGHAKRVLRAAREVPLDRLLIETDSPPHGKPPRHAPVRQPADLPQVIDALSALRGEGVAELATATTQNARALFSLPELP